MKHNQQHRPLWPEFYTKIPKYRNLYGLHKHQVFDENGEFEIVADWENLTSYMARNNAMIFTYDLSDNDTFRFLFDAVQDKRSKVLCNSWGKPISIRVKIGRRSYWIVQSSLWSECELNSEFLHNMWDTFIYFGMGTCTSPSSMGSKLMKYFHMVNKLKYHTCCSLYCEQFIRQHNVGGVAQALGVGKSYDEALLLDKRTAYLEWYSVHPDKGATYFVNGHFGSDCFTYFARCTVTILEDMPMGLFPVRSNNKSRKLSYPTKRGTYESYLWKEHSDFIESKGLKVQVHEGYCWSSFTTDNKFWAEGMYGFRREAPTKFIEAASKKAAVGGMGSHGIDRYIHFLVDESEASPDALPITNSDGEPLALFIETEYNLDRATMVHWWSYTQDECNISVMDFAYPFSESCRLIDIDFDSVLVLDEKGELRDIHIAREYSKGQDIPPGTWLWELLHDVKILAPRSYTSREKNKTPGVRRIQDAKTA